MCIEPPRPRLKPDLRAKISARAPKRMKFSGEVLRVLVVDLLGVGQGLAAEEALHDALKLALIHLVHGRVALGENLTVRAVRAEMKSSGDRTKLWPT